MTSDNQIPTKEKEPWHLDSNPDIKEAVERFVPCLSGYHPHPLYVVCLLGLQARVGAGALRRRSG